MLMIAALLLTLLCFLGGWQSGLTAFRWGLGKCTITKLRVLSSISVGGHNGQAEGEDGIGGDHIQHDLMPFLTNPRIELSALHHNLIGGSSSSLDFLSLRFFTGLLTNSTIHTVGYESKVISSEFESDSQHSVRILSSFSNPQFSSVDGAAMSTAPLLDIKESLTIYYLEQELKLSKETLTKIILKYSWILYLKVDTNLRPTIEVMKSFGLKDRDVRLIVSKAPSVLAINYDFTLPEKLIALQKMFFLSRINLSKVLVSQPYLLTSSIGRNLKIATFLSKNMKLSERQIKALIVKDPRIGMSNLSVLSRCWSALIDLYGLSRSQAQSMVLRYPYLMSFKLLKDIKQRLEFFCSELHLSPPPAVGDIQLLAYRFPQLLFMDVDVFLRPNAIILKTYLQLDTTSQLLCLLKIFPQLLGYNPITLRKLCDRAIRLLTGRSDLLMDNDNCQPQSTAGGDGYSLSYSFPAFQQLEEKFPSVFNDSITDSAVDGLDDEGSMDAELLLSEMKSSDLAINPYLDSDVGIDCSRDSHEVVLIDDFEADRLSQLTNASRVSASDWVHSVRSINPRDVAAEFDLIDDIVEDSVAEQQLLSSPLIESHPECSQSRELTFLPLEMGSLSGNMMKDMPAEGSSVPSSHLEAVSLLAQSAAYLEIAPERALHMLRTSPWILAYRTARSQGVLSALMVSLGLSRAELTKCVVTYPRLLSLSLEGKLSTVLRAIAVAARKYLRRNPYHKLKTSSKFIYSSADFQHNPPLSNLSSQLSSLVLLKDALTARRNDNVRSLVRELVVRYPLILGTAMPRITERMDAADRAAVEWSSYLAVLRRSPDAHSKWMEAIEEADLLRRSELSPGSNSATITMKQTKKKPVSMARVEPLVDKVMVKKNATALPHVKSTQGLRVEKTRTYSSLRLKLKRVSRRIDGRYQVTK